MRAKAAGYQKAPRNDIDEYLPLTPTRKNSELQPMDRFRRYEEVKKILFLSLFFLFTSFSYKIGVFKLFKKYFKN